jgi:hypothetical protein
MLSIAVQRILLRSRDKEVGFVLVVVCIVAKRFIGAALTNEKEKNGKNK